MVENTENKVVYEVGTEKVFPFALSFFEKSDIHCYLKIGDFSRELVSGEFTVEPKDDYRSGANITLEIDAEPGSVLTIVREIPIVQGLSLPENGRLPSEPMENQFDRIIMICQQLKEELGRSLVSEHGFEISVGGFLEMLSESVNQAVSAKNAAAGSATNAAESATNAEESATNAEESAKNAAESATNAAKSLKEVMDSLSRYLPLAGGDITGELSVNGREVDVIDSIGSNFIRYSNGIQLCWSSNMNINGGRTTITLPMPFLNSSYMVLVTRSVGSSTNDNISPYTEADRTTTAFKIVFPNTTGSGANWLAVGKWK